MADTDVMEVGIEDQALQDILKIGEDNGIIEKVEGDEIKAKEPEPKKEPEPEKKEEPKKEEPKVKEPKKLEKKEEPKKGEEPKVEKPGEKEEIPPAQIKDYKTRAIERARTELKHKTDLTDAEIDSYINQRFLSGGRKIQREVESRQKLEKEFKPFRDYHGQMEANPIVQAIRAGKKVQIVEGDKEDDELLSDEAKQIKTLNGTIATMQSKIDQALTSQDRRVKTDDVAAQRKEAVDAANKEITKLSDDYPLFSEWVKVRETTGQAPPELEEILDRAEDDGVSLTYAAKAFFEENGLSAVARAVKAKMIKTLTDKTKQKAEKQTLGDPPPKEVNYTDEDELAEHLASVAGL